MKNPTKKLNIRFEELPLRANKMVSEEFYNIIGGCSKGYGCCADDECCAGWYCRYFDYGQEIDRYGTGAKYCLKG
jgi:hypothetical protein